MGQLNVKQAVPNVHEINKTFLSDPIVNQAHILAQLCHPYLPSQQAVFDNADQMD